jgi:hypothetical protein
MSELPHLAWREGMVLEMSFRNGSRHSLHSAGQPRRDHTDPGDYPMLQRSQTAQIHNVELDAAWNLPFALELLETGLAHQHNRVIPFS